MGVRTVLRNTLRSTLSIEGGRHPLEIRLHLGGRVEIEGARFSTRRLQGELPLMVVSPNYAALLLGEPFFTVELLSPTLHLISRAPSRGRGGGGAHSRVLKRLLSRVTFVVREGTLQARHGVHTLSLHALRARGTTRGDLLVQAPLVEYDGPMGLWMGKGLRSTLQGERLETVSISYLKLFSRGGRELDFWGRLHRLAGDAFSFHVQFSSGLHYVKTQGRVGLADLSLEGRIVFSLGSSLLLRTLAELGIATAPYTKLQGRVLGDLNLLFQHRLKRLTGDLLIKGLVTQHPLLAPRPVHWPTMNHTLSYSNTGERESLAVHTTLPRGIETTLSIQKQAGDLLTIKGDIPVQPCSNLLQAIPKAMLPTLSTMELTGKTGILFGTRIPLKDRARLTARMAFKGPGCQVLRMPPTVDMVRLRGATPVTLTDREGHQITRVLGPIDPAFIPLKRLPVFLTDAVLAAEDMRFFKHDGFDWPLLVRALGSNLESRRIVKGASTISQQLTKNLFLNQNRSVSRKLEEAILTWQLERTLTKERILEIYLNVIEMAPGVRGVRAGAHLFFKKGLGALTPLEAAHLASIIPAPRYYYKRFRKSVVPDDWGRQIRLLLQKTNRYGRLPADQLREATKQELVIQDY